MSYSCINSLIIIKLISLSMVIASALKYTLSMIQEKPTLVLFF